LFVALATSCSWFASLVIPKFPYLVSRNYSPIFSSDALSGTVYLYDGRGGDKPLETISSVHRFPVHVMAASILHY